MPDTPSWKCSESEKQEEYLEVENNNKTNKVRLNLDQLNDVVTVPECAAVFGVTPHMVYNMIAKGEVKCFKFGTCRLILKQDIKEMIGYSDALDRKQKNLEVDIEDQEEDEKKAVKPSFKSISIPRFDSRSYRAIELDD